MVLHVSFDYPTAISILKGYDDAFQPYFNQVKSLAPLISLDSSQEQQKKMEAVLKDSGFQSLVENAQMAARSAVTLTLQNLADVFGLDQTFLRHMPYVMALDSITYLDANRQRGSDSKYYWGLPTTFFSSKGLAEYKHPSGMVISLYLPEVSQGSLIEESFHYLHHLYEQILGDKNDATYLKGLGVLEKTALINGICHVKLLKPTHTHQTKAASHMADDELFFQGVFAEAGARFTEYLFGEGKSCAQRLQSNLLEAAPLEVSPAVYYETLDFLCSHGPDPSMQYFLEKHGKRQVSDLGGGLFGLGNRYLDDLIHFLGYGFGERLHAGITDPIQLQDIGAIFFRPEQAPKKKLAELMNYCSFNRLRA